MKRFAKSVAQFWADTRGTATVEAAIIMPLLAAWFVGGYVFFDAFYARSSATKAAYTVGDVLSRRTSAATPDYIDRLGELYGRLSPAEGGTAIRVTNVEWDAGAYKVLWSWGTSPKVPQLTDADMVTGNYSNRIPNMYNGETLILVEAYSAYRQPFNVGWIADAYVFEEFVVTRPRYATQIAWNP